MQAEIIILGDKTIGCADGHLFGQFIELAGACINGGLYDPGNPRSRADGIREDLLEAIRELKPTHIRYPGGCAAAYFDWQDLVGPKEGRPPSKLFGVTGVQQSTAFGIPEAHAMCRDLGADLYLTVNAHTQSPQDAADLVEYLNGEGDTKWANRRRAHGREEAFGVRLFSLGNEIYGDWQAGQKTADEYAAWCREAIPLMKHVDPDIKVVVCGYGRPNPEWDRIVLFNTVGLADMISVHNYFGRPVFADSMAAYRVCEAMLATLNCIIDEAVDTSLGVNPRTCRRGGKPPVVSQRTGIAFDEWNVWYRSAHDPQADLDETFNYMDALTVATLFHVVLRNSRTIKLSNISLAVNTLASIKSDADRIVKQTIWYAQKLIRNGHRGRVVESVVEAPQRRGKHERFFCGIVDPEKAKDESLPSLIHYDDIPALDVLATVDQARGTACVSIVQKMEDQPLSVRLSFRGLSPRGETITVHRLTGDSLLAENTLDSPSNVGIETTTEPLSEVVTLPPASLTVLEFTL